LSCLVSSCVLLSCFDLIMIMIFVVLCYSLCDLPNHNAP
jgi:hypothetical protein